MKQTMSMLFICLCIALNPAKSQEVFSLKKLLLKAVENNAEIKKSGLSYESSKQKKKEVFVAGLPQIEGNITYSRMGIPEIEISPEMADAIPESLAPLLEGLADMKALHTTTAGVQVTQLLYSQSYLTGLKQARTAEEMQQIMLRKTEEDVIKDISVLYYQILMNYSNKQVINENIRNLSEVYDILKLNFENDFAKQTDVSRIKVNITNLQTQSKTLENAIDIQQRYLKIMCGLEVDREMILDTTSINVSENKQPGIAGFQPGDLPEFLLTSKQTELASLAVQSEKAAFVPNLAAFGQFNYSSYSDKFNLKNMNNMNTVGLKAIIPICSSGAKRSRVRQAELGLEKAQLDFDYTQKYLDTNYKNSLNSLLSAWSNFKAQQGNRQLANEVYKQVKLQYDEGMASLTDLLNVELSLLDAENLYHQQLLKYKVAEIDLLKSTGKLKSLLD